MIARSSAEDFALCLRVFVLSAAGGLAVIGATLAAPYVARSVTRALRAVAWTFRDEDRDDR